jgi:predicted transposase YdaD
VTTQKIWDSLTKQLVQTNPQDLISWISPNTVYESELNTEIQKDPIRADLMYIVRRKGRKVVFHIEIQKQHDNNMGRRVWEYNVSTTVHTGFPVYSVVLYLVQDSSIVEPPYTIDVSDDEIVHHFVFQNIKLWEIAPDTLLEQNLPGLLPLLPLAQEGNRREVVQQMFQSLQQVGNKDLLALGYAFAVRKLKKIDQPWLKELFMSVENIFEGTWIYDEILQKGMAKGLEQGLERGLEQGLERGLEQGLKVLRATLVHFVKANFPDQLALAEQQVGFVTAPSQAQELLDKLFVARTTDEVRKILLSLPHA